MLAAFRLGTQAGRRARRCSPARKPWRSLGARGTIDQGNAKSLGQIPGQVGEHSILIHDQAGDPLGSQGLDILGAVKGFHRYPLAGPGSGTFTKAYVPVRPLKLLMAWMAASRATCTSESVPER